jgi:hypothetical protein
MRADRVVYPGGRVSDRELYVDMLANAKANRMADEAVIESAVADGMDRSTAEQLFGGAFDVSDLS